MELDELKKKKIEELKAQIEAQQQSQMQEESQLDQQIDQLEHIVKQHMTKEAILRYGNLKTAHPEKAIQVLALLGQNIQTGNLDSIDDNLLKQLLIKLNDKKEFNIKRK